MKAHVKSWQVQQASCFFAVDPSSRQDIPNRSGARSNWGPGSPGGNRGGGVPDTMFTMFHYVPLCFNMYTMFHYV